MAEAAAVAEEEAAADADIRIIACGAGVMPDVIRDDAFLFFTGSPPQAGNDNTIRRDRF